MSDFTSIPASHGDDAILAYYKSFDLFKFMHNFDGSIDWGCLLFVCVIAVAILFLLALIINGIYDWVDHWYYEEFEYNGLLVSKNYKPASTSSGFMYINNTIIPTSSTSPEDWCVFVELDEFESEVRISVSESYFSKCQKGDKVKVSAKKLWLSKKYDCFQII